MSLPISGGQVASEYQTLWNAIKRVQADSLNLQSSTAGGAACSLRVFLTLAQDTLMLRQIYDQYTADQTTATSIVAYSQQQAPGVIFSATDFTNMRTAAGNILTAIAAQYPHDGNGKLLDRSWSDTLGEVWATATAAQTPSIMSAVSAFLATLS